MIQKRRHGKSHGTSPQGPRPHGSRSSHSGHSSGRLKSYRIICSGCGKEFISEVPPPVDKKLLCIDCFKK